MFVFLSLFVAFLIFYVFNSMIRPRNFPPGPSWLPFVGNSVLLKTLSKKLGGQYLALQHLAKQYKTDILGIKLGGDKYVVVFGKKLVQQIYTSPQFLGRPDGFFIRLRTMGTRKGITMTDGALWQEQRAFADKILRQLGFNKNILQNLLSAEIDNLVESFRNEHGQLYLNERLSASFINTLWIITAGKNFTKDEKRLSELLTLLKKRSQAFDMAGGILNQMPWVRFVAPEYSGYNLISLLNSKLRSLFLEIIDEHRNTLDSENRDFIDAYLREQSRSGPNSTFTDDQLIATCLDFFIAGSLTTSYTLDFAIFHTVSNARVKQKLIQELDKYLGSDRQPTLDDKSKLQYVKAVITESQRYQHVVPTAGPRRVLEDTTVDGYNIPKDSIVLISLRSIHYDEDLWGDPNVFRPERFLDENGNFTLDEGLCTFGLGKRQCPGTVLAKNYLFLAFAALFHNYEINIVECENDCKSPVSGILLSPQPYKVEMKLRKVQQKPNEL